MKGIILIDKNLPVGLIANTAACLGLSLGSHTKKLIGENIKTKDGAIHLGITNLPLPIFSPNRDELYEFYSKKENSSLSNVLFIGFSKTAQCAVSYEEYKNRLSKKDKTEIELIGLCIYGPKSKINKISSNFKLLK